MEWLAPWCAVKDLGPGFAQTFESVLAREVAIGHPLYGVAVDALGKLDGTDDVLFQLLDGSGLLAVVHLTWTHSPPERLPWPITELFDDWDKFVEKRMQLVHDETLA